MCVRVCSRGEDSPEGGSSGGSVFGEARRNLLWGAFESCRESPAPPWLCDLEQGFDLYNLLIESVMGRNVLEAGGPDGEHLRGEQVQVEGSAEDKLTTLPCLGFV